MYTLSQLQARIDAEIKNASYKTDPERLYEPIEYILGMGGKRLRPALVLLACNMFSDSIESAVSPALAIEIFHNFTLVHDDMMDHADMRRGVPTVHKKWDYNTGILSGDAMSILAYKYLVNTRPEVLSRVLDTFSKTALEVCEGQQYDMDFELRNDVTVSEYLKMIELKTAVLLAGSLKIGAIIGGATEKDYNLLYEFGRLIGLAFQLQDDYLDTYGDQAVFGKKIGGDILCNKKTFLLISAINAANNEDLSVLNGWISDKSAIPEEKIEAVTNFYNKYNISELSRKTINELYEKAKEALHSLSTYPKKTGFLEELAEGIMKRNH